MLVENDFGIIDGRNIRHVRGETMYPVQEFYLWLHSLEAGPESILNSSIAESIVGSWIRLLPPFNIDDNAASFLYDGAVEPDHVGIRIIGSTPYEDTRFAVIQDGHAVINHLGFINPDPLTNTMVDTLARLEVGKPALFRARHHDCDQTAEYTIAEIHNGTNLAPLCLAEYTPGFAPPRASDLYLAAHLKQVQEQEVSPLEKRRTRYINLTGKRR